MATGGNQSNGRREGSDGGGGLRVGSGDDRPGEVGGELGRVNIDDDDD